MINSETTVREVALQIPQSTRLFERLKIDYCCGGNQPLAEACTSAGIDVDNVMEMLAEATQSTAPDEAVLDFQNASLTELIEHILKTHHVFTKSEMDRLEALTSRYCAILCYVKLWRALLQSSRLAGARASIWRRCWAN